MKTASRMKKAQNKRIAYCYAMLAWPLLLFLVFYVYLNLSSFALAFQYYYIDGTTEWAGIVNFKAFLSQLTQDGALLRTSLINSLLMYAINLVICMPLYMFFAYVLFHKAPLRAFIKFSFLLPMILSGMIYALIFKMLAGEPLQRVMQGFGFADFPDLISDTRYAFYTSLGYMIWISFGTSMIVYPNAMNAIDPGIFESAKIDGVRGMFDELRYIILPLIYPTISTFLITGFASILSNGGVIVTFYRYIAPPELYNMGYFYIVKIFQATNFTGYPMLAAGGIIMTLIVAPLTIGLKALLERFNPVRDV